MKINPGTYRRYKGNLYYVIGEGKHSETQEELVIYKALYGDEVIWVRPKKMFLESVKVNGKEVKRFEIVDNIK